MRSLTPPKLHSVLTFLNIILRFDTNSTEFYLFLISRRNHRSNEAFEPVHTFSQMTKKIVFLASEVVVILVTHIWYALFSFSPTTPHTVPHFLYICSKLFFGTQTTSVTSHSFSDALRDHEVKSDARNYSRKIQVLYVGMVPPNFSTTYVPHLRGLLIIPIYH